MRQVPLLLPFSLALFFLFFTTVFIPGTRLLFFAPFFAILFHRCTFLKSLWIASLCGLLIDLCTSELHFGATALNFCITAFLCFQQKRHFFEDKAISLSLFTICIALVSSIIHYLFLATMNTGLAFSLSLLLTDFLIMPIVDGIYAFIGFSCPLLLYIKVRRIGVKNLFNSFRKFLPLSQHADNQ